MIKIAYYDNADGLSLGRGKEIPCINKSQIMHALAGLILDWVDRHDAHLTIKTKERKEFRSLKHGVYWIWFRKQPPKEIYKYYPEEIRLRMERLKLQGKLEFNYERSNLVPAQEADAVIVTLAGDIIPEMFKVGIKRIIVLDQHHWLHHNGIMRKGHTTFVNEIPMKSEWLEFKITDEVEFFENPEDITKILDHRLKKGAGNVKVS